MILDLLRSPKKEWVVDFSSKARKINNITRFLVSKASRKVIFNVILIKKALILKNNTQWY
jgi:hypothetical protein